MRDKLQQWQRDIDLTSACDPKALNKLPAEGQEPTEEPW